MSVYIQQIVDEKSCGIMEYATQLDARINQTACCSGTIAGYGTPPPSANTVCLYHFSNATRWTLLHLRKNRGNKNVVIIHDLASRNWIFKPLQPFLLKIIERRAHRIVVHTPAARQLLLQLYPSMPAEKVEIIPHGTTIIDVTATEKESLRRQYGYKPDEAVLFKLGRITRKRGHIDFIRAFDELSHINLCLLVAGICRDDQVAAIMKKNDRIHYLGFADSRQVEACYKLCDAVMVYRSNTVGESSSTIVYGLGHGKPVFASDHPSFADIIGDSGVLFKNDVGSLKEMLGDLGKGTFDLERLSGNARRRRNDYTWDNYLQKLLK